MSYFVTGGTGFIGRNLIDQRRKRKGHVYVLVRRGSKARFNSLVAERWSQSKSRLTAVTGDLTRPALGVSGADAEKLDGKIRHFFHLAAIYDMAADSQSNEAANIEGTRHAITLAEKIRAGCFHHTSSIAVAGLYRGPFRTDMLDACEAREGTYFHSQ